MEISIQTVDPGNEDLHRLIAKLDEELLERYPKSGIYGVDFNDSKVGRMVFIVAYADSEPVLRRITVAGRKQC